MLFYYYHYYSLLNETYMASYKEQSASQNHKINCKEEVRPDITKANFDTNECVSNRHLRN